MPLAFSTSSTVTATTPTQIGVPRRDKVRAAFGRTQRLNERRKMMQTWADRIDQLKVGNGDVSGAETS
jgi:hypothetical protein